MRSGDLLGDHGQRTIVLALIFEAVIANYHGVDVSAPLTQQLGAGLQDGLGIGARSAFLELCGQGPQAALQRQAHAAIGSLLQLIREGSDEQVTT
jgi:hypothetical protein